MLRLFICPDRAQLDRIEHTLARIESKLDHEITGELHMAATLDTLNAEVTRQTTVNQSALTLIQGIAAALKEAGTDPVKLQALQDQLTKNDDDLAAAVAANSGVLGGGTPVPPVQP